MNAMPLTVSIRDAEVLAKIYKGEPSALTFSNRKQAQAAVDRQTDGLWYIFRPVGSRPFYVARFVPEEHYHPAFCRRVEAIANLNGLPPTDVYRLWRQYSEQCLWADQSAIVHEFLRWNAAALPHGEPADAEAVFCAAL